MGFNMSLIPSDLQDRSAEQRLREGRATNVTLFASTWKFPEENHRKIKGKSMKIISNCWLFQLPMSFSHPSGSPHQPRGSVVGHLLPELITAATNILGVALHHHRD